MKTTNKHALKNRTIRNILNIYKLQYIPALTKPGNSDAKVNNSTSRLLFPSTTVTEAVLIAIVKLEF